MTGKSQQDRYLDKLSSTKGEEFNPVKTLKLTEHPLKESTLLTAHYNKWAVWALHQESSKKLTILRAHSLCAMALLNPC